MDDAQLDALRVWNEGCLSPIELMEAFEEELVRLCPPEIKLSRALEQLRQVLWNCRRRRAFDSLDRFLCFAERVMCCNRDDFYVRLRNCSEICPQSQFADPNGEWNHDAEIRAQMERMERSERLEKLDREYDERRRAGNQNAEAAESANPDPEGATPEHKARLNELFRSLDRDEEDEERED